ncbi:MAG: hypothetical protein IAG13_38155 [Deltaproteobacteria bacterium]|nr:hypothetical protein [Nannocystaceae bacterium]
MSARGLAAMLHASIAERDRQHGVAPEATAVVHYLTELGHPREREQLLEVLLFKSLHRRLQHQVLASHAHVCAALGVDEIRLLPGLLPATQPCDGLRFALASPQREDHDDSRRPGGALFFALAKHATLQGPLTPGRCLVRLARLGLVQVRVATIDVSAGLHGSEAVQSWLRLHRAESMTMTALQLVVTSYGRGFLAACGIVPHD